MLTSFLLSSPGPIFTGAAALSSRSATQIADFIRRTVDLVALFIAWWAFRRRDCGIDADQRTRLERIANLAVALSMACSGLAMLGVGIYRFFTHDVNGNVALGLTIAVLGLITNTTFWWRYKYLGREAHDPVLHGQHALYRAKSLVDLCVVAALTTVALAPRHAITPYVDAAGSVVIACYLLFQALDTARYGNLATGDDPSD